MITIKVKKGKVIFLYSHNKFLIIEYIDIKINFNHFNYINLSIKLNYSLFWILQRFDISLQNSFIAKLVNVSPKIVETKL